MDKQQVNVRIDAAAKIAAEAVFAELGLRPSDAVNLFYRQVALQRGLPFALKIPNSETLATFANTDQGQELQEYESVDAFFKRMNNS